MANAADYVDPYRAYNFKLQIQGVTAGHFTECSSLGVKVHPIKYREAGNTQVTHCVPGQLEYADVTLRYGLTDSTELWDWFMSAVSGNVQRRNVSVLMLDSAGANETTRWNLVNAWPSEWRGAPLDALRREVAIESVTLVFDELNRDHG
ncbi:MAG TPA: phage tail protein [Acidimicrobiales bacterium]|jgi:phage tail-like protein|nr:phage tail protein [Acidimicrobiales bacterium]